MKTLTYEQARSQILDGDLISVFKAHSLFGFATQFFTGQYTHVGMAIWEDDRLRLVEINGGKNHLIPLSQLLFSGFDVSEPPSGVIRSLAKQAALDALEKSENYGFFTTIVTGFIEFFKINIVINWRKGRHCAGFIVGIYDKAGWAFADGKTHTYVISPTKLTGLVKFKFRVMPENR
jgi:hypothetical protein